MIRYFLCLVAAAAALTGGGPASAQSAAAPVVASAALKARVGELVGILNGKGDYAAYFAPGFVAQVSKDKFDALRAQIATGAGAAVSVDSVTPVTPNSAALSVTYERGVASMRMSVETAAPYRVDSLLITGISAREASISAVIDTLKGMPGTTSFAFAQLGGASPRLLGSHNPDQPLAIGSAFKLIVLAELVRATNAGERHWSDLVSIDGNPLPGGAYAQAAAGTKVSIEELATRMISVSDNSATDILLRLLGRAKVEAMLEPVGIRHRDKMRPFMSTLEMFKLKGIDKGALATRYLALDEAGRRTMLDKEVRAAAITSIDPKLFKDDKPLLVDRLEWFASTADLVRVMDWLRINTANNPNARSILSRNPGIGPDGAAHWHYVGFKGGSEPGVINMTLLLESKAGQWYAISGSWNNPVAGLDEGRFAGLMTRSVELASAAN